MKAIGSAKQADSRSEYSRERIRQQAGSEQSVHAFCSKRRLTEQSFYCWRKRLGTERSVTFALKKGRRGTMTHDYKRNATTTLFAALEVLQGRVVSQCYERHRHQEFLKFLRRLDQEFPGEAALASGDGQLWNAQAPQGAGLVQKASSLRHAFCAYRLQ